ncbi:TetR family transcriptional regulator [Sphingobium cupriresistens LL01]|uniref:TetR family transcriptional regulator n=2 Tax=Sphingobium cupriresistens TaxID=1132417 RepID=A0A0J7Y449_9SPHN|nr:TetR family transcriptional regulator [Sphingobium cupriresistens LL01]
MTFNASDDGPRVGRGRPRNPAIEARIMDAALLLYGRMGWQGFNLEGVARGANVSKDALYRRWKTREALLESALMQRFDWIITIDNGNIRDDLLALATRTFDVFSGTYGEVALQLRTDARRFPDVRAFAAPYREMMVLQGRGIVRRALDRGELPAEAKPGLIMDLLIGGITNHIVSTPSHLRDRMLANANIFLKAMVDVVLLGAQLLGKSDS